MGYIAIKDKNWGSVTSGKEPVTLDHLIEMENHMLKKFEALHQTLSPQDTAPSRQIKEEDKE